MNAIFHSGVDQCSHLWYRGILTPQTRGLLQVPGSSNVNDCGANQISSTTQPIISIFIYRIIHRFYSENSSLCSLIMDGSCQCGSVTFRTPTEKPVNLFHCHCIDCRKQSASAFGTSAIFPFFRLDENNPAVTHFSRVCDSGRKQNCTQLPSIFE